tara:strand:+ start:11790 stop:12836 length:1047 start_codon:yes stop_codon:yes gene_type:complete
MKVFITLFFLLVTQLSFSQFQFDGFANRDSQNNSVYLSVIEDFRKISGVFPEQILAKATLDSTGYFIFKGDNLPTKNRIYRIHIDTCNENEQNTTHFSGHCPNSEEIIFIANNATQLSFPLSFDQEAFCKVDSNNEKANVFLKIDSLKNDMRFAFGTFRSEANRKINSKKWFTTLQDYGELLDEPLAELYIFSFLSNRSNSLYSYYLKDLKENGYYLKLLNRLKEKYPNSAYMLQYENELEADLFLVNNDKDKLFSWWIYVIIIVLFLSVFINLYLFRKNKTLQKDSFSKEKLTSQEQKTLSLILTDKSNKEIASELFISVSTVKTHINNLYKKLNVTSREEVKNLKL